MFIKFLPYLLVFLIALIAGLNFFAFQSSWYFYHWWFDLVMHFLGGLFIGLTVWWLYQLFFTLLATKKLSLRSSFILMIGAILIMGLGWELFEFSVDEYWDTHLNIKLIEVLQVSQEDTSSDLLFDILGGVTAWLMVNRFGKGKKSPIEIAEINSNNNV